MTAKSPADASTIRPRAVQATSAKATPWLTVLWHPALDRVGDVAPVSGRLSRLEPELAVPGGAPPAPLADPHVSRTPALLTSLADGGMRIEADPAVELLIDGAPGPRELDAAALARGVVLELAGRVALLLHLRRPPTGGPPQGFVGASEAVEALRADIARVADLDVPVLVAGETGSGKEHVARALHAGSTRAGKAFVAVNMATLPPSMAVSQLFGHARGAFTGADRNHTGFFEQAAGGTLFLDEVADAQPEVQAMLLRTLETGEIQPIGADARRVDVRVIAASDADLVDDSEFRPQLYHRLAGYRITVPPLRARPDDIGRLLASFLVRELASASAADRVSNTEELPWLPTAAVRELVRYSWPGNVRELANVARHLAVIGRTGPITLADAVAPLRTPIPVATPEGPRQITDDMVVAALAANRWKTSAAAGALGVSRTTLYALMDRCSRLRKARDLDRDEIATCRTETGGDLDLMSERLQVSKRGLQLRIRELGM